MQSHAEQLPEGKFLQEGRVKGTTSSQQWGGACGSIAQHLLPVTGAHDRAEEGDIW